MGAIYDARRRDGLTCHDVHFHTEYDTDSFSHSKLLESDTKTDSMVIA
jgi:hypothetical protein